MSIIRNLSIDKYHSNAAVSHSMLRDFAEKGPAFYYRRYIAKDLERKESAAFYFGNAFETLVQRPHEFNRDILVRPEGLDGRTKEGKAWSASVGDRPFLTAFEYRQMERMLEALREHSLGQSMIAACETQVTITADWGVMADGGPKVQARPDWVCLEGSAETSFRTVSIDLKTCDDLNELKNARKLCKYGYHTQAALVRRLLATNDHPDALCYLFVVEKEAPHRVGLFELDVDLLAYADKWLDRQLARLAECYETNVWTRVEQGITRISKPSWLTEDEQAA